MRCAPHPARLSRAHVRATPCAPRPALPRRAPIGQESFFRRPIGRGPPGAANERRRAGGAQQAGSGRCAGRSRARSAQGAGRGRDAGHGAGRGCGAVRDTGRDAAGGAGPCGARLGERSGTVRGAVRGWGSGTGRDAGRDAAVQPRGHRAGTVPVPSRSRARLPRCCPCRRRRSAPRPAAGGGGAAQCPGSAAAGRDGSAGLPAPLLAAGTRGGRSRIGTEPPGCPGPAPAAAQGPRRCGSWGSRSGPSGSARVGPSLCAGGFVPGFVGAGKSLCPLVRPPKAGFYLENPGLCHR